MYSVGSDESGKDPVLCMPRSICFRGFVYFVAGFPRFSVGFTTTKYVYEAVPRTSWSLFQCDEVCQHDCCHGFHYDRSTKGEAYVVAARDLEGIHLTGLEVECLLSLSDT